MIRPLHFVNILVRQVEFLEQLGDVRVKLGSEGFYDEGGDEEGEALVYVQVGLALGAFRVQVGQVRLLYPQHVVVELQSSELLLHKLESFMFLFGMPGFLLVLGSGGAWLSLLGGGFQGEQEHLLQS